jgi:hypothetical protein
MDKIVRCLADNNFIFTSLKQIDAKSIGLKKKIDVFVGVNLKDYYVLILYKKQKSRFLKSNIESLEEILQDTKKHLGHNIKKYVFIVDAPICSKAKGLLVEKKWRVINDTL